MADLSRPNVVIFAGAGASKAVDPESFPTTVEFFDRLPTEIRDESLFEFIVGHLMKDDAGKTVDIEQVLWALDELRSFLKSSSSGDGLIGYALRGARLAKLTNNGYNFGHLPNVSSELVPRLNKLISNINAVVYGPYIHA